LGSERTRTELGEGEALLIVSLRDPPPLLDEVALHIPNQGHRPTEAERP